MGEQRPLTTSGDHGAMQGRSRWLGRSVGDVGEAVWGYEDRAAKIWLLLSVFWIGVATLWGLTIATELIVPEFLAGIPFLVFSRVRPMHVNGVLLAWLTSADFGLIFYFLPRLCGVRKMWSETLGYWCAWAWGVMYVAGVLSLGFGYTIGKEYWEFIWPVDVLLVAVWAANVLNIVMTVLYRRVRPLYVAAWWALASPIWLLADFIIANAMWRPGNLLGNGIPGAALSEALNDPIADLLSNWWGSHNLFGMWLTPALLMTCYYLVPRITGTALYSHTLSLISFWGIAFIYTSVGAHHLMQAPIPNWEKTFATVYSILLCLPVFAFVANIWLTMRGNWEKFAANIPLRFTITGFVFYFLVNPQGSFQAIQNFSVVIHFTNFTIGHAHLALLGGMTIVAMGGINHAIPLIYRRSIYSPGLMVAQYWLVTIGFLTFFWSLTIAAFLQGMSWLHGVPEINVLPYIHPFYIGRAVAGVMIFTSALVQIYNIYRTATADTNARQRAAMQPYIAAAEPSPAGR